MYINISHLQKEKKRIPLIVGVSYAYVCTESVLVGLPHLSSTYLCETEGGSSNLDTPPQFHHPTLKIHLYTHIQLTPPCRADHPVITTATAESRM